MDNKTLLGIAHLELSKAFDRVVHRNLLKIFEKNGIWGSVLLWMKDFLFGRVEQVLVNGNLSAELEVQSGVPEGNV